MAGILRTIARVANRQDPRPPGFRKFPDRIVLDARDGVERGAKPPVRIFVGTEPEQLRPLRVFIWSIEQVRDPARIYQIYLMSDLRGFDRRLWVTGFTNYRFAIPHLAGGRGRAIYNDVDQVYLADPAELFDMDMGGRGFLALTPRDTSVMLIDCNHMGRVWTLDLARRMPRDGIEAHTKANGDLWGPLPRVWNARDQEYVPACSKVLHYTTIHAQPWQPFPQRFVYQRNPVGFVWLEMEHAAEAANFQVFSARRPSADYLAWMDGLRELRAGPCGSVANGAPPMAALDDLDGWLVETGAATVLDYQLDPGRRSGMCTADGSAPAVVRFDPSAADTVAPSEHGVDAVVCGGGLEYCPEEDLSWVIDSMFCAARRGVYASVITDPAPVAGFDWAPPLGRARSPQSWMQRFEAASAHYPGVHCRVVIQRRSTSGTPSVSLVREWGRRPLGNPAPVWVLTDDKPGHTTQSIGLAEALGIPYDVKRLRFNLLSRLGHRLRGASRLGLSRTPSASLAPPWPDLVISTGHRTAPVARWIGRQSQGRARLVQLGRRGGEATDAFDLVVSCAHFRLPLHPRRMEVVAPLNDMTVERLARAAERWRGLFDGAPRPHVVLVAGGSCARHQFDVETARRMGAEVRAFAESIGGSVWAITGPRTGADASAALRDGLGDGAHLHEWRSRERDNSYVGYLALADALVVTGESESMLAEAAATGKPLFIYPLPERPLRFRRISEWIARHAETRPRKAKGTVRPQQGLEYLCASLLVTGIVRPSRRLHELHDGLIRAGAARYFGAPFDAGVGRPLREAEAVARRVRGLLGYDPAAAPPVSVALSASSRHGRPLTVQDPTGRPVPDNETQRVHATRL